MKQTATWTFQIRRWYFTYIRQSRKNPTNLHLSNSALCEFFWQYIYPESDNLTGGIASYPGSSPGMPMIGFWQLPLRRFSIFARQSEFQYRLWTAWSSLHIGWDQETGCSCTKTQRDSLQGLVHAAFPWHLIITVEVELFLLVELFYRYSFGLEKGRSYIFTAYDFNAKLTATSVWISCQRHAFCRETWSWCCKIQCWMAASSSHTASLSCHKLLERVRLCSETDTSQWHEARTTILVSMTRMVLTRSRKRE
jgi:hypothetical protein